ncbi:hypothetical protein BGX21_003676, partial [Mortierella sp. AD011]
PGLGASSSNSNDSGTGTGSVITESTESSQSNQPSTSRLTRKDSRSIDSTRSTKRKKHSFRIIYKELLTDDDDDDDEWLGIPDPSSPSPTSSLKAAFTAFQITSRKRVVPHHDISSLLSEALSLNGIWWSDNTSLSKVQTQQMQYLDNLSSIYSPKPDSDLQLLCFNVQTKLNSRLTDEQMLDYMHELYGGSFKRKQAVRMLERLTTILPSIFKPEEEHGEAYFILTHLQCYLDLLFGQKSRFPISYNIEHDSGNSTKSEHDHGVRSDFFIEIPCPTLSSISNSEIVGLFGEVKPPEKDRRKAIKIHDFWKLVRMAKDEINSQIMKGVCRPMVILIQVFGFQLEMYTMTMDLDLGIYVLYKAAEGFLPRSTADMSGIGNIISIFMHSKALLQQFQEQIEEINPGIHDSANLQKFIKKDIICPE